MSVCELLLSNLVEHYDAYGIEPNDISWDEFLNSEEYGIMALMSSETTGYPPKLSGPEEILNNVNANFERNDFEVRIGSQEANLLYAIYQRASAIVPEGIPISCELIDRITQTPVDQLANIDYSNFEEGEESGGESSEGFGGSEGSGGGGFGGGGFGGFGTPFGGAAPIGTPAPSTIPAAIPPFGAPPPTTTAPFPAFPFPAATPSVPFQPQIAAPPASAGQQPAMGIPANPAVASSGKDLPYITVSIRGLKPSEESRILVFKLTEPNGDVIRVNLFLTAGQIPADFVETKFSSDEYDKMDNEQKAAIHTHNRRNILKETIIPMRLSNGVSEDGVCAQRVRAFELVEKVNQEIPGCAPESNRPKSMRVSGAPVEGPKSGPFGTSIAFAAPAAAPPTAAAGGVTFTGFGGQAVPTQTGGTAGGLGALAQLTTGTMGGPPSQVPETEPAGTVQIQVPDFDDVNGPMKIAYKIPGGPTPIAVSNDWYWYELPNGDIVKSRKKYLGLGDKEWWNMKHGPNQKATFPALRMRMTQLYGPNYRVVQGSAKTTSGPPPKSTSGRRKAGATLSPIPGFTGIGTGPVAGTQMPAVGTVPPTLQAGAQPPIFGTAPFQPTQAPFLPSQTVAPSVATGQATPATSLFGAPPATQMKSPFGTTAAPAQPGAPSLLTSLLNQPPTQTQAPAAVVSAGQNLLSQVPAAQTQVPTPSPFGQQPVIQTTIPPAQPVQPGVSAATAPNPFASIFGGQQVPGQPTLAPPVQSQPSTKATVPTGQPAAASGLTSLFGI